MKKEIADMWIAALRGGDYKQGRHQLRNTDDTFCCLGVLCNLHAIAHPEIAARQTDPTRYLGYNDIPHPTVTDWAEMMSGIGMYPTGGPGYFLSLSVINDKKGYTFEQIADVIEQHWRQL